MTYYKDCSAISPVYSRIEIVPGPIKKLYDFCSDNNISVEGSHQSENFVITFSKFGHPFTVNFGSFTNYIGADLDRVNTIIDKLTDIYKYPSSKVLDNSLYGTATGGSFENGVLKYSKEDVDKSMKEFDFNRIRNEKLGIEKVIFSEEATVVLWKDGTKTVVKCQDGDNFDKEKGLAMAICKKALGTNASHSNFNDIFKKWITED